MRIVAALLCLTAVGCQKEGGAPVPEPTGTYCYYIDIKTQNNSNSTFGSMFRLMTRVGAGQYAGWERTYTATVADADAQAVVAFDSLLATIDNDVVSADLVKSDYMSASLMRVQGSGGFFIKGRKWTVDGYTDF